MKYFAIAALLAVAQAYDEAEGPTKEDNGEADPSVVYRESDIANGKKFSGWTNPLSWSDEGADDDTVVLQLNAQVNKHKQRDEDVSEFDQEPVMKFGDYANVQEGAWVNLRTLKKHKKAFKKAGAAKDEYDGDSNTVSQYDHMDHFKHGDWGVPAGQHGELKPKVWA